MKRDICGVAMSLLFIVCHFKAVNLNEATLCKEVKMNYQMSAKVIRTSTTYTSLQCQDQCFRTNSCDGINLSSLANNSFLCQLIEINSSSILTPKNSWMYVKLNRTSIAKLWVESPCKSCGEGQVCNGALDVCGKEPCKCEYGRIDNGTNKCQLFSCLGSGILNSNQDRILTPTFMKSECSNRKPTGLTKAYTCFYLIEISDARNISIEFSTFRLNDGSFRDCNTAKQRMSLTPTKEIFCGNHGQPIKLNIFAKKISIMLQFKKNTNPCMEIVGNYTVL